MSRLRGPGYLRLTHDVYVPADTCVDLALRCAALLEALPDVVFSHRTAARLLGLPVDDDGCLHVTRAVCRPVSERAGTRTHRSALGPGDVLFRRGLPVTAPARTFSELAAELDHVALVVLGDAVARRVGLARLAAAVEGSAGRRGVRRARAALSQVDPGSDSPAETRCRLLLHSAGFRGLVHGVRIFDEDGQWLATPDLADPEARVAIQYDGLVHLGADPERRRNDIDRDELARAQGWEVVVLTAVDLRDPVRMVEKVAAAYRRAARRR